MKCLILAIIFLTFVGAAHALPSVNSVNIDFIINGDTSVEESIHVIFSGALNSSITYKPESDVTNLEILSEGKPLLYRNVKSGDTNIIEIMAQNKSDIIINFISHNLVFSRNDVYQFLANVNFDIPVKKMTASLSLPEGYGLYDDSYTPITGVLATDGKNIIINWDFVDRNSVVFSAKFLELNRQSGIEIFIVIIIACAAVASIIYYRKKSKKEFLSGFREDEKKVIAYMTEHKTAYQNIIEKEFHFSRAKMTRIAKHLESKQLLEKKKYGRTNRLRWKR